MSWQNLIRDWLRRTAEQRLRETMAAEGEQPEASSTTSTQQPSKPIPSAHVGVVLAEHRAAVGLIDRLEGLLTIEADRVTVHEGALGGRRLALVVCGPTSDAAAEATEALVEGHHPNWIIAAGFCTGLVSDLSVGDIVLANHVISADGELPTLAPSGSAMHTGRLLSMAISSRDVQERQRLAEQFRVVATDLHSYFVAEATRQHNLPCAAVSVVRQAVAQFSSQDVDRLRRKQSLSRRVGLLTGMLLNRPGSLKTLWNEKEQDLVAADCLADGVTELIDLLSKQGIKEPRSTPVSLTGKPTADKPEESA